MVEIEELEQHKEFFDKLFYFLPANELNEPKELNKPKSTESKEKQKTPETDSDSKPKYQPVKIKPKITKTRPGFEGAKFIRKKSRSNSSK